MSERIPFVRIAIAMLALCVAVMSCLFMPDVFARSAYQQDLMKSIDEKVDVVMSLTGASAMTSVVVSVLPGDVATPISEKLADFTEYFLIILCILYAEQFIIAIFGIVAFRYLLPAAIGLFIIGLFSKHRWPKSIAIILVLLTVGAGVIFPFFVKAADKVYESYSDSIQSTISYANELSRETSELTGAGEDKTLFQSVLDRISMTVTGIKDRVVHACDRFIESIAILLVTCCIFPVLGMLVFFWLVKLLTGVDFTAIGLRQLVHHQQNRRERHAAFHKSVKDRWDSVLQDDDDDSTDDECTDIE